MEGAPNTVSEIDSVKGIHRLPPEILANIFSLCAISPLQGHIRRAWSVKSRRWHAWQDVTRVCRHWHRVALGCSTLWATIYLSSVPGQNAHVNAFISRSGTAPLTVIFDESRSDPRFDEDCEGVLTRIATTEASRVRELYIRCSTRTRTIIMFSVPRMAPYLRILHIDSEPFETISINLSIAEEHAPSHMQSLRLDFVDCSQIAMCNNLQNLSIRITRQSRRNMPLHLLLHAIGSLALLQSLLFTGIQLSDDDRNLPVVRLPSIKRLEVMAQHDELALAKLFACLDIPTDAAMRICYYSTRPPSSIFEVLRNKLSARSPGLTPSRLYLSQDDFYFYIRWNPKSFSRVEIPIEEPPLPFLCELSWIYEDEPDFASSLCHQLYSPGIQRLSVTVDEPFARAFRGPLVTLYSDVEEVHFGGSSISSLVVEDYIARNDSPDHTTLIRSVQDRSLDPNATQPQRLWPFHRLRTLSISCIVFDACEGHDAKADEDNGIRKACIHTFRNALESRIQNGRCTPLERLGISRCYNLTEESLEYLRGVGIAADVSWDGVEREYVMRKE